MWKNKIDGGPATTAGLPHNVEVRPSKIHHCRQTTTIIFGQPPLNVITTLSSFSSITTTTITTTAIPDHHKYPSSQNPIYHQNPAISGITIAEIPQISKGLLF